MYRFYQSVPTKDIILLKTSVTLMDIILQIYFPIKGMVFQNVVLIRYMGFGPIFGKVLGMLPDNMCIMFY